MDILMELLPFRFGQMEVLCSVLLTALLRYHLHAIKSIYFKYKIKKILVKLELCNHHHDPEHFYDSRRSPLLTKI